MCIRNTQQTNHESKRKQIIINKHKLRTYGVSETTIPHVQSIGFRSIQKRFTGEDVERGTMNKFETVELDDADWAATRQDTMILTKSFEPAMALMKDSGIDFSTISSAPAGEWTNTNSHSFRRNHLILKEALLLAYNPDLAGEAAFDKKKWFWLSSELDIHSVIKVNGTYLKIIDLPNNIIVVRELREIKVAACSSLSTLFGNQQGSHMTIYDHR